MARRLKPHLRCMMRTRGQGLQACRPVLRPRRPLSTCRRQRRQRRRMARYSKEPHSRDFGCGGL